MRKILITGINGFVASHLGRELKSRNCFVAGVGRQRQLSHTLKGYVDEYYHCDLVDPNKVSGLPLDYVDGVISLAGLANVGASFEQKTLYMKVNVEVLTVLSERILKLGLKTRVLAISTGAVYSPIQPLPLKESSNVITCGSPYAMSKIAMESEAEKLRLRGLNCIIARPFNHVGPGQEPGFLVPDLYKKIKTAVDIGEEVIRTGDLTTKRDYTDVRDVVRAYADLILAEQLNEPIYNICSGRSITGKTIFDLMTGNMKQAKSIRPMLDQELLRPNDPKDIYGDNSILKNQTGWEPKISIEQTIRDFVASMG